MHSQKGHRIFLCLVVLVGILFSPACKQDLPVARQEPIVEVDIPPHFPIPPSNPDNPLTISKIKLGEQLFFDPRLSADNTISCGTCHLPEKAFADNNRIGVGIKGRQGFRNVPTLVNTVYFNKWLWDGGNPSLEAQVLVPLQDHNEMASDIPEVVQELRGDATYEELAQKAFGKPLDADVLVKSLAAYERTLISGNSKFDQFLQGKVQLSPAEAEGHRLFEKVGCTSCHSGVLFTSGKFENNGLDQDPKDAGRFRITFDPADEGSFKVPTLRNLSVTAPYMHDGRFLTLEEVLEHYNKGGENHPKQSERIRPLELTKREKQNIIAFLLTLTDVESFDSSTSLLK